MPEGIDSVCGLLEDKIFRIAELFMEGFVHPIDRSIVILWGAREVQCGSGIHTRKRVATDLFNHNLLKPSTVIWHQYLPCHSKLIHCLCETYPQTK